MGNMIQKAFVYKRDVNGIEDYYEPLPVALVAAAVTRCSLRDKSCIVCKFALNMRKVFHLCNLYDITTWPVGLYYFLINFSVGKLPI